jgi:hypothetical protein
VMIFIVVRNHDMFFFSMKGFTGTSGAFHSGCCYP